MMTPYAKSICHISSVHAAGDPRVRLKEVRSVSYCYKYAYFVTGDMDAEYKEEEPKSLKVIKVYPGKKGRLVRIFVTAPRCIFKALRTKSDIYHIHDPELLLWAWILRLSGSAVVYDIHEDYVTSISQKSYIPEIFRSRVGQLFGFLEKLLSKSFFKVIAESYYKERFPSAVPILNYPILKDLLPVQAFSPDANSVIYTGNVTPDRGALLMAGFHQCSERYDVRFIGRCSPDLYKEFSKDSLSQQKNSPQVEGVGHFVEFSQIIASYAQGNWLAGIAVFPDTEHYRGKELTKFFEYMAVGLPIIASNFPVWKKLIEDQGVGICVPPGDNEAVEKALDWLKEHPQEALAMSRRGKELARTKYSWESQAEKLIDFYQNILDQKKKPSST